MKKHIQFVIIPFFLFLYLGTILTANPEIINPGQKARTAFAIFIDRTTYEQTSEAVNRYRQAVENDGLAVYTVIDDWKKPEDIRTVILELADRKPLLEGVVYIGEIPIPMLRNAQHLTSAFKIDQKRFEWIDTSVPSDCYYDDFDLEFTFIKQDSANPLLFYYTLNPGSHHKVQKDIYSGRIHPPAGDRPAAEIIGDYLMRVAEAKAEANRLDNMLAFAGHGYHSESVKAWSDEQLALRELFPILYTNEGHLTYYYHTMSTDLKNIILRELQVPSLDLALFHAHGSEDSQLLLGYPSSSAIGNNVEAVKLFVRSKLRSAQRRDKSVEEAKAGYIERYGIPEDWFAGAFDDSVKLVDSLYSANLDIYVDDIRQLSVQAELMIFDECFNGAFMLDSYVAGEYVFGNGTTVAGIANTVNVKQDIWSDEFIGLLGQGIRVGQMHRNWNFIESQIIGDPTFHFSAPQNRDLNSQLAGNNQKTSFWYKLLRSDIVSLKVLAINHLTEINGWRSNSELVELYRTSPSFNVRMAALKCLAVQNGPELRVVLAESINDSYELIRRMSAIWMREIGDEKYIPLLAETIVRSSAKRVNFQAKSAIQSINAAKAITAVDSVLANSDGDGYKRDVQFNYRRSWVRTQEWLNDEIMVILPDTSLPIKKRIGKVRTFRNYKFHSALPDLMVIATNQNEKPEVRKALLEAFGWYHFSPYKVDLINTCQLILEQPDLPEMVKLEALKTANRFRDGNNNPLSP